MVGGYQCTYVSARRACSIDACSICRGISSLSVVGSTKRDGL